RVPPAVDETHHVKRRFGYRTGQCKEILSELWVSALAWDEHIDIRSIVPIVPAGGRGQRRIDRLRRWSGSPRWRNQAGIVRHDPSWRHGSRSRQVGGLGQRSVVVIERLAEVVVHFDVLQRGRVVDDGNAVQGGLKRYCARAL